MSRSLFKFISRFRNVSKSLHATMPCQRKQAKTWVDSVRTQRKNYYLNLHIHCNPKSLLVYLCTTNTKSTMPSCICRMKCNNQSMRSLYWWQLTNQRFGTFSTLQCVYRRKIIKLTESVLFDGLLSEFGLLCQRNLGRK